MKKITLALIACLSFGIIYSQTEISGSVKDSDGSPIIGANVIISGTTEGTTVDFDGNFVLTTDLTGQQSILISSVGFSASSQEVELNGDQITLTVVLEESNQELDEVVLSASSSFRSQKQAPLSISSKKMAQITRLNPNSQADILRDVPGITAEGGGGETATNLFVRGLPSGGQYVFNPLQYDGMSLMSTFGLNSSAHDVYARPDIGFKGVEFVRGGAAVLYGAGSVAGLINYTSKTGDEDEENIINVEWGNDGRLKTDFYSGGQLGGEDSNTFYAFTGFVRKDDGPIETGLPTRGVQFRGNIKKLFKNGSFTLHGQFINDRAQFFLPLPLNGSTRERINGNDGNPVEQLLSGELAETSFLTAGGVYKSPIEDGVYTKGSYVMGDLVYNLSDRTTFKSKVRYANYLHNFALYVGGNGTYGNPLSLSNYVNQVAQGNSAYTATYQGGSGQQINGNDLVVENLHVDRLRPMTDYSGEANIITKSLDGKHTFTFGTYMARTEAEDVNYQYRVLSEFNNNPRLVNLSYTLNGDNVTYSDGGIYNRIGMTSNKFLAQSRTAFYLTDEMVFDRWRFDVGLRIESTSGTFNNGGIEESTVYADSSLTDALRNVRFADGSFTTAEINATDWAISLAGLYELNESTNLYANFSRGFFFPQLRGFTPTPGIRETNYNGETIIQSEVGAKFGSSKLSGSIAAYYVTLQDRIKIDQAIVGGQLVDQSRNEQTTESLGLEATWKYRFSDFLSLYGTATFQNHEIKENQTIDLTNNNSVSRRNEGNEIGRQPNVMGSLALDYNNQKFDANFTFNHTGAKFTDDGNNVELDAITLGRLSAGYTFNTQNEGNIRLGVSVFNLFDSQGLTEGNPRAGIGGQVDSGDFFFGRPVLPRRMFLTATFSF